MKDYQAMQRRCHTIEKRINRLHRIEEKLKKERASLLWQISAYYQERMKYDAPSRENARETP